MNVSKLLRVPATLPIIAMLALSACGGGGGGGTAMMQPGTGTGMQPGTGTGMQPGTGGEPMHEGPTLLEAFATQQEQNYSLSNATLARDGNSDTTSISNSFRVNSIQRTSEGGYTIVFQDGTDEGTVTFLPENCVQSPNYCRYTDAETGQRFAFSSITRTSDGVGVSDPSEFTYLAGQYLDAFSAQMRTYFVFGLGTAASGIPATGEAVYHGSLRADAYRADSSSSSFRQRYSGSVRLVANFDMSRLTGNINNIRGSAPGSSTRVSWPTSSFVITNGQFANGQFTATLSGMDSDSAIPDSESVRGFMGEVIAQLYGPNAEEIGGAITATRDLSNTDNDLNLYGLIVGSQLEPRDFDSAAFVAGVTRHFDDQESVLYSDDGMATVERMSNGWSVTLGGRTFALADSDFVSGDYIVNDSTGGRYFWSWTGDFSSAPRIFDHFDVKGWFASEPDFENSVFNDGLYLVHGNRTPQNAMPTSGTATYLGRMGAREMPSDQAVQTVDPAFITYRGSASMTADFAASSIEGSLSVTSKQLGRLGSYIPGSGDATFNAQINGNQLTASDLAGTGDLAGFQNGGVRGSFFGPAAEEMGGVFDAQDTSGNRVISGYFGAKKDQ